MLVKSINDIELDLPQCLITLGSHSVHYIHKMYRYTEIDEHLQQSNSYSQLMD